jgi:hypothetical protein
LQAGFRCAKEFGQRHVESARKPVQEVDARVFGLALNAAEIRAVDAGIVGESFLRHPAFDSQSPHVPGNQPSPCHGRSRTLRGLIARLKENIRASKSAIESTQSKLAGLGQQTDRLASLDRQLKALDQELPNEPSAKLLDAAVVEEMGRLTAELDQAARLSPIERGDASELIGRSEAANSRFDADHKAAQIKYDGLTKLEAARQTKIATASEALAELSKGDFDNRLSEEGIALRNQLQSDRDALLRLEPVPLWQRPDYSEKLRTIDLALGRIPEIIGEAAQMNAASEAASVSVCWA